MRWGAAISHTGRPVQPRPTAKAALDLGCPDWFQTQGAQDHATPSPGGAENRPATDGRDSDVTLVLKGLSWLMGSFWSPNDVNRSSVGDLGLYATGENPNKLEPASPAAHSDLDSPLTLSGRELN